MWIFKIIFTIFLAGVLNVDYSLSVKDVDFIDFTNEIESWVKSDRSNRSATFESMIQALYLPSELQRTDWRSFTGERATNICTICQSIMRSVILLKEQGTSDRKIKDAVANLCTMLNLQPEIVCNGTVELHANAISYIIAKPNITESSICGVILQTIPCGTVPEEYEWSINIDNGVAKSILSEETNETLTIVQISDFHYDPLYEPYGNAECNQPTCCRKGQNVTNSGRSLAGYWGDYYFCDSPWHSIVNALDQIKNNQQNISYIYYTGDIIDHGVWEITQNGNTDSLSKTYTKMYETFQNIPVYPILGNHEANPADLFSPSDIIDENLSSKWLYTLLANLWINFGWLPESTRSTILQGGFYTVSPRRGFRIIALNNNVCYSYNWWILYEPVDPNGQLKWLSETLLQAEQDGEYVHILAHIPPGDQTCLYTWGREYRRIINRFAHIITGQFNGHTHKDELRIFYDLQNITNAINVAWNGGSVTTYSNLNPNYKVYTVNANTYEVEDIDNWMYNLTLANETPDQNPNWYKSYSFKEEYSLNDLSLKSLNSWVYTLARNQTVLYRYYENFVKHADPLLATGCNSSCLFKLLCRIVTTAADDSTQCNYFSSLLNVKL